MRRVVCLGGRHDGADAAGGLVHDLLARRRLPADLELVDGGLGGLNLLACLENAERVVLVDAVRGVAAPGQVVRLDEEELSALADVHLDHGAGPAYLVRAWRAIHEGSGPAIGLVGLEAPFDSEDLERAADAALAAVGAGDGRNGR